MRDRVALVTGASSGLGEHFAGMLASRGARVIAAARREDRLEALVARIREAGGTATPVTMDVTDAESVASGIARGTADLGPLDIVVNNAGVASTKASLELTEADWAGGRHQPQGRLARGGERESDRRSRRGPGSMVNIASILGLRVRPVARLCHLESRPGAAHESARARMGAPRHPRECHRPGYIQTDINREFFATPPGQADRKRIPQRRIGERATSMGHCCCWPPQPAIS